MGETRTIRWAAIALAKEFVARIISKIPTIEFPNLHINY